MRLLATLRRAVVRYPVGESITPDEYTYRSVSMLYAVIAVMVGIGIMDRVVIVISGLWLLTLWFRFGGASDHHFRGGGELVFWVDALLYAFGAVMGAYCGMTGGLPRVVIATLMVWILLIPLAGAAGQWLTDIRGSELSRIYGSRHIQLVDFRSLISGDIRRGPGEDDFALMAEYELHGIEFRVQVHTTSSVVVARYDPDAEVIYAVYNFSGCSVSVDEFIRVLRTNYTTAGRTMPSCSQLMYPRVEVKSGHIHLVNGHGSFTSLLPLPTHAVTHVVVEHVNDSIYSLRYTLESGMISYTTFNAPNRYIAKKVGKLFGVCVRA